MTCQISHPGCGLLFQIVGWSVTRCIAASSLLPFLHRDWCGLGKPVVGQFLCCGSGLLCSSREGMNLVQNHNGVLAGIYPNGLNVEEWFCEVRGWRWTPMLAFGIVIFHTM